MPWRDTLTITRQPDGTWKAKLHGYPFYYTGATAEECLRAAGETMDISANIRTVIGSTTPNKNPAP